MFIWDLMLLISNTVCWGGILKNLLLNKVKNKIRNFNTILKKNNYSEYSYTLRDRNVILILHWIIFTEFSKDNFYFSTNRKMQTIFVASWKRSYKARNFTHGNKQVFKFRIILKHHVEYARIRVFSAPYFLV